MNDEPDIVPTQHLSALAPPDELIDWRLALCFGLAHDHGVLDAVPGTAPQVAATTGLDPAVVENVLHVLAAWGHLRLEDAGRFTPGPAWLVGPERAALAQHGTWIRRWAVELPTRMYDRHNLPRDPLSPPRPDPTTGLALLESAVRPYVVPLVDTCLARLRPSSPRSPRILDLGGGHGAYAREFARRGCEVTVQDLPPVIDMLAADGRTEAAGVSLYAGDAFTGIASGPFDLVLCGTLTNLFDLEQVRILAGAIAEVLAPQGRWAIATWMRDRGQVGAAFGMQMLVATIDGDAHPSTAYRELLTEEGYLGIELTDIAHPPLALMTAHR